MTPTQEPLPASGPAERERRDDHDEPAVVRALRPIEAHGAVVRPGAEDADDRDAIAIGATTCVQERPATRRVASSGNEPRR